MNLHNVKLAISAAHRNQFLNTGLPELGFVGRSNVGKSSLINKVLNRRNFARTSSTPGKTATINYYEIDSKAYLVDLPGYGYAKVSKDRQKTWGAFIEDYFRVSKNIALVFSLIDIRHNPTADDIVMVDYLKTMGLPFIVIATKADKLSKKAAGESLENIRKRLQLPPETPIIAFSATNGQGRDEIVDIIQKYDITAEEKDVIPESDNEG